jgi:hypothetical protein
VEIIKQSKINGELVMKEVEMEVAKKMIVENHYSHKWNTAFGKINIGVFKDERLLGVASFGNLMNPKSYKSISKDFNQNSIVELNRLWIDDELGMNSETILISSSFKIIKALYPEIKAIQSFADGRLGCGTIYKASNFKYYGYTESLFYEDVVTGETHHKVPMENTKRPTRMIDLNLKYTKGLLKPFKVKTYKYICPLYKKVKIDLKELPYPEYDKGLEYLEDYTHNINLITRSIALCKIYDRPEEVKVFGKYLLEKHSETEITKSLDETLNNKSVIELAKKEGFVLDRNHYKINKHKIRGDE